MPAPQELAPLILGGGVAPIPQWQIARQRQLGVLSTVNHDVKDAALAELITANGGPPLPRTDRIRGSEVAPNGAAAQGDALRAVVQNPAYSSTRRLRSRRLPGRKSLRPAVAQTLAA